jgi:DNA repair photolyase
MKVKKIKSIKRIKEKATVYNFHVPKYESYVANGFVTHNCYVARHRDFGNPLTISENTNEIVDAIVEHYYNQPSKFPTYSNQQDRWQWTYDLYESSDGLSPANIEITEYIIRQLLCRSDLKPTFATKLSNKHTVNKLRKLMGYQPLCRPYRARIRVSLMPQCLSDIIELGTSKIIDRIRSIRALYELNYECHINFSPIVMYGGNQWMKDYIDLCKLIDRELGNDSIAMKIKNQLKCEIIFLTHHEKLHNGNLRWNSEAEKLLWTPEIQEYKINNRGDSDILRYKLDLKSQALTVFKGILKKHLPYCEVRYAF